MMKYLSEKEKINFDEIFDQEIGKKCLFVAIFSVSLFSLLLFF